MVRRRKGVRRPPKGGLKLEQKPLMRCYEKRAEHLSELGYASYDAYLSSDAWKRIRATKLRHHRWCILCDKPPTQVHHLSYAPEVLLGLKQALLVTMCDRCHRLVEFDGCKKRTLEEANTFLIDSARAAGKIGWVRMIMKVIKHYRTCRGNMR